ncbi:hypothetical protein ASG81_28665 [Paenibacillus sp. Soil522]|nr:hypothetical protein ASG81_28665 [Paenibacillus sp. Soil522]
MTRIQYDNRKSEEAFQLMMKLIDDPLNGPLKLERVPATGLTLYSSKKLRTAACRQAAAPACD